MVTLQNHTGCLGNHLDATITEKYAIVDITGIRHDTDVNEVTLPPFL